MRGGELQIVDATLDHVEEFLRRPIRQADVDEWVMATGKPVGRSLMEVLTDRPHDVKPRALLNAAGTPICLWGVTLDDQLNGHLWLIAAREAEGVARSIHRLWRGESRVLHGEAEVLYAHAYSGNALHLHWLEAVGFRLVSVWHHPMNGVEFRSFVHYKGDRPCVVQ